jgi:hypothetical protein
MPGISPPARRPGRAFRSLLGEFQFGDLRHTRRNRNGVFQQTGRENDFFRDVELDWKSFAFMVFRQIFGVASANFPRKNSFWTRFQ